MKIRPYRAEDAPALAELSASCARRETDFVLNPLWETEAELVAEFDRFEIAPEEHLVVADDGRGDILGVAGFLRHPGAATAGLFCPIVKRGDRGRGVGGELLRGALVLGADSLGVHLVSAGIGTRNRAGYSLLVSHGFRPVRQHFLMRCDDAPRGVPPPESGIVFEPATPEDVAAILEIWAFCGFEDRSSEVMTQALSGGRHFHAVARDAGAVVAFVEIETHWPDRVWVAYVGVAGPFRDRGVGSSLVAWALQRRFDAGARVALLMLSPANRTALRAYEKVGFRRHRMVDVLQKSLENSQNRSEGQ